MLQLGSCGAVIRSFDAEARELAEAAAKATGRQSVSQFGVSLLLLSFGRSALYYPVWLLAGAEDALAAR